MELKEDQYINEYDTEFIKMVKSEVADRLTNRVGQLVYPCDLGFSLTDYENCNGSWYCSEYEAKEDIKKYLDEFSAFQSYYRCNFGEPIWFESEPDDYHHSIECVHCTFMISAIECCFNQAFNKAFGNDDTWNHKVEITEEFVFKIIEGLKEIDSVEDIF